MARSSANTIDKILTEAYALFYKEGFARVSVDAIARKAGVTKRTLYNHFESKDALVEAVLLRQHALAFEQIKEWGNSSEEDPSGYLGSLFERLQEWASEPRWFGSGFTRLTMELADLPGHPARRAAHQHKLAVETWLETELDRRGAADPTMLARQTVLLIEGCFSTILIHGDASYAVAAADAAKHLAGTASG